MMNAKPSIIFNGRFMSMICSRYLAVGFLNHLHLTCHNSNTRITEVYKPNLQFVRNKYGKKQPQRSQEESDSDSDDGDDAHEGYMDKNAATKTVKVNSLRTDLIIKSGLSLARNKVENLFYDSRIRVNGKKILKKSAHVNIGDEIDVIRNVSPMNPDFVIVSRIELLSAKEDDEKITVKLRRFKSLTVENYVEPWKGSSQET